MNEPYSPATPRPTSTSPPNTMKMFMCFLTVFIIAQSIGTVLFCLYLHMKLDKTESALSLHEDYVFLRKVQKCRKPEGEGSSFLDCKEIINKFQDLLVKDPEGSQDGGKFERQKGTFLDIWGKLFQSGNWFCQETIFFASLKTPSIQLNSDVFPSTVLHWQKTGYAPMSNLITYKGGKLKVEKEGLYYIYSQVSFCTKPTPGAPFTVFVYLNLPTESDRVLLKGQDTHSSSSVYCALQSTHLGGVFELRQGDVVFVNVTDSTQVNYDHGNTYFGMFKLY
uniref:CD40 ligand n=1 Tax=Pelusios castaneus TaxID=367368 RepID=A0A8C8SIH2_9SAUR